MTPRYLFYVLYLFATFDLIAQYPTDAYWADEDGIHYYDVTEDQNTLLIPTDISISDDNFHLDQTNQKIYYADDDEHQIHVADYDGGNRQQLFDLADYDAFDDTDYAIMSMAFDFRSSDVYLILSEESYVYSYTSSSANKVYRFNLVDQSFQLLWETDLFSSTPQFDEYYKIVDIAIDTLNDRLVYPLTVEENSQIITRSLTGQNATMIVDDLKDVVTIDVHEASESIIFSSGGGGDHTPTMYKSSLDGENLEVLFQSNFVSDRNAFILDDFTSRLFFKDIQGSIVSSDLNGLNIEKQSFIEQNLPQGIDLKQQQLFYVDGRLFSDTILGDDQYELNQVIIGYLTSSHLAVDEANEYIYFGDSENIVRIDQDGGNHTDLHALTFDRDREDWALDVDDQVIMSVDRSTANGSTDRAIYKRPLDDFSNGEKVSDNLSNALIAHNASSNETIIFQTADFDTSFKEVVYDFENDIAYYLLSDGTAIYQSSSTTNIGEELIFFEVNGGINLYLDVVGEKIYWSSTIGSTGQYRANLDGSNVEKIDDNPISALTFIYPNSAPEIVKAFVNISMEEDGDSQVVSDIDSYFNDPEEATLSFSVSSDTSAISVSISDNQLTITPQSDYNGVAVIDVSAIDVSNKTTASFSVNVSAINDAPVFSLSESTIVLDQDFTTPFEVQAIVTTLPKDEEDQTITYSLNPSTIDFANVTIDQSTGLIRITSITEGIGTETITVTADDGQSSFNLHEEEFILAVGESILFAPSDLRDDIQLYPNPFMDELVIDVPLSSKASKIALRDVTGKIINQWNIQESTTLDLSSLGRGAYLMTIETNSQKITKRLIKEY